MVETLGLGDADNDDEAVLAADSEMGVALPEKDGREVDEALLQEDADAEEVSEGVALSQLDADTVEVVE